MKKILAVILMIGIICSCSFAALADVDVAYPMFSDYLLGRGTANAEKNFKTDFIDSEAANMIYKDLYYFATYGLAGQEDPAVIAYWDSIGLTKTVYDADDADRMWSVFVPNGRQFEEGYQFPLVFCLHGNDNDIMLAETYGFAKLGGTEGFITVVPWAANEDIIIEEIPRILGILHEEGYPIDDSRIYATGFSKGGMATQNVGLYYSDLFAAIAPGGAGPMGIAEDAAPITSGQLNRTFQAEAFENAFTLPVLFFGGTADNMPIATTAINEWIKLSGAIAPEMTNELFASIARSSAYGVERMTGLSYDTLDQMEVRKLDGQYYYIGSYYNEDGVCTFRTVAAEGAPHWLMPSEASVVWEFMKQFARDPETHELIYLEK